MASSNDPVDLTVNSPGVPTDPQKAADQPKKKLSVLPTFLPPCKVCSATASGYHYGANTCEACKAFFRRSIGHENAIKPCQRDKQCAVNPKGKISCSFCRHQKCLSIGMAKDGCRKGRYTYEKRTQDTKEIRRMQADKVINRNFQVQHCAETVTMLTTLFEQCFADIDAFLNDKDKIDVRVQNLTKDVTPPLARPLFCSGHAPNSEARVWFDSLNNHFVQMLCNPEEQNIPFAASMDMIFEMWTMQAEKAFHGLTSFAKALPGFSDLLLDDRIILLKQGRVDALNVIKHKTCYVHLPAMSFYSQATGDIFLFPIRLLHHAMGEAFEESMMKVTMRAVKLGLCKEDIAVLLAFVILMSDREGLQRTDQVERLQDKMLPVLQYILQKNHPDQPRILPDTLLILPMLRESSEIHKNCLGIIRDRVRPDVTPLVSEMLQT